MERRSHLSRKRQPEPDSIAGYLLFFASDREHFGHRLQFRRPQISARRNVHQFRRIEIGRFRFRIINRLFGKLGCRWTAEIRLLIGPRLAVRSGASGTLQHPACICPLAFAAFHHFPVSPFFDYRTESGRVTAGTPRTIFVHSFVSICLVWSTCTRVLGPLAWRIGVAAKIPI
jgi:hypothetical protein